MIRSSDKIGQVRQLVCNVACEMFIQLINYLQLRTIRILQNHYR